MWAVTYPKEGTLDGAWALWRVMVGSPCVRGRRLWTPFTNPSLRRRLLGGMRRPSVFAPRTGHTGLHVPSVWVPGQGGDWAAAVSHLSLQTRE